jgi:hypothetical protein
MDANESDSAAIMSAPIESGEKQRQIFYEKPIIKIHDALKMELQNFIDSVKGKATPIVSGREGRDALNIAIQIHNKILEDLH